VTMVVATKTIDVSVLERAQSELQAMAKIVDTEVGLGTRAFEGLAAQTDTILKVAGDIVGCVESEKVSSVLPKVQSLGAAARQFIAGRLQATAGILETVATEVGLLRQLSQVARGQQAIALEIKSLSVLTNIEVARLGNVGDGFQYLARELAEFSKSVTKDTKELARHTDARRVAIEETRRALSAELPRLREELTRIETDLGNALAMVDGGLTQLSGTPIQFKAGVEEISRQVAGVVAAIQAHDITRQQMEHVVDALAQISAKLLGAGLSAAAIDDGEPWAYAGLIIQSYQLRVIKQTVGDWASQIKTCTNGILAVSASDVVEIGPAVLEQERQVSSQLARIETLERESQIYSEKIQRTLGGLSNLMQLVSEHLQRSKSVRDRLRMLAFNSIIEANHLGARAAAILAISTSIKGISAAWSEITDRSGQAMEQMVKLVKETNQVMESFSQSSNEGLREAQGQTHTALEHLRSAAEFAGVRAAEMKAATEKMQTKIADVGDSSRTLDKCFGRFDAVLMEIEGMSRQLELERPEVKQLYDAAEIERVFAASYTTEMERDVLRAALGGTALPVARQNLVGNSVELF